MRLAAVRYYVVSATWDLATAQDRQVPRRPPIVLSPHYYFTLFTTNCFPAKIFFPAFSRHAIPLPHASTADRSFLLPT